MCFDLSPCHLRDQACVANFFSPIEILFFLLPLQGIVLARWVTVEMLALATVISAGNKSRNARKPVFSPQSLADICAVKNARQHPLKTRR